MFCGFNSSLYFAAAILEYIHDKILRSQDENLIRYSSNIEKEDVDEAIIVDLAAMFLVDSKYQYVDHKRSHI